MGHCQYIYWENKYIKGRYADFGLTPFSISEKGHYLTSPAPYNTHRHIHHYAMRTSYQSLQFQSRIFYRPLIAGAL